MNSFLLNLLCVWFFVTKATVCMKLVLLCFAFVVESWSSRRIFVLFCMCCSGVPCLLRPSGWWWRPWLAVPQHSWCYQRADARRLWSAVCPPWLWQWWQGCGGWYSQSHLLWLCGPQVWCQELRGGAWPGEAEGRCWGVPGGVQQPQQKTHEPCALQVGLFMQRISFTLRAGGKSEVQSVTAFSLQLCASQLCSDRADSFLMTLQSWAALCLLSLAWLRKLLPKSSSRTKTNSFLVLLDSGFWTCHYSSLSGRGGGDGKVPWLACWNVLGFPLYKIHSKWFWSEGIVLWRQCKLWVWYLKSCPRGLNFWVTSKLARFHWMHTGCMVSM